MKLHARDIRQTDPKVQIQAIFSQWLPIERTILEMIVRVTPHPGLISDEKAVRLMCSLNQDFETLPKQTQELKNEFKKSDANSENVIVFISKMVSVDRSLLPENKPKPLTQEEIARKRELARQRIQQRNQELEAGIQSLNITNGLVDGSTELEQKRDDPAEAEKEEEAVFIAFARVYSGTLKKGSKIFALNPKHDPSTIINLDDPTKSPHITEVTIDNVYLLMGKELEELDEVPAGNICGIRGLQQHVLKTATLSNNVFCPSFCDLILMATPIFRVAVEPKNPSEMPKLVKGLKLLNQADACVQVIVQENGEHVLVTLGEVHLERCIYDLENQYSKILLNVSSPIVPFRETIVPQATVDMVNEAIVATADEKNADKSLIIHTTNKQCQIKLLALPLPKEVTDLLEQSSNLLKSISKLTRATVSDRTKVQLDELQKSLPSAFKTVKENEENFHRDDIVDRIWSIGPKKCGTNILLNLTNFEHKSFWDFGERGGEATTETKDIRSDLENSFVNGFQIASLAGPICEEPMQGVCFVVEDWSIDVNSDSNAGTGQISGQIISSVKEGCRKAFQNQPQRIVTPMYSCNIVVSNEVLGKSFSLFLYYPPCSLDQEGAMR